MPGVKGRSGRNKKPNKVKELSGSKHVVEGAVDFDVVINIEPPEYLDELAELAWRRLCPQLCRKRILQETDIHNLEIFCVAYSHWRQAGCEVENHGIMILDVQSGKFYRNPSSTTINEASKTMASFGGRLGLDPGARQNLPGLGGDEEKDNPFLKHAK